MKRKGKSEEEKKATEEPKSVSDNVIRQKSPDEVKQEKLLHPSRAERRSVRGHGRSPVGSRDTSGTSGSDTGVSDTEDPDGKAVTFRVEYRGKGKQPSGRERQVSATPRRKPDIVVSSAAIGRGGIIDTQG